MPDREETASEYTPFDPDLAAIGFIEPEFVDEFVGYADRRIVLDTPLTAGPIGPDTVPTLTEWHYEACDPVPQYRQTLRWRQVYGNGSEVVYGCDVPAQPHAPSRRRQ